ncbi:unnamed protein product [Oncorhynchus mykiss]|uniref:Uncharacterized protein n=1 Tax=Oncorhynchus mykiss TaxID=8022 RepID=A0A060YWV6_ONCMY|nr:unnamed protein product [Oncorhynchus mykiss]
MFTVNTKDAGEGGLSLAMDGPSKADISCVDNQDGTCSVSYLPVLPGQYSILVKYNDKHIPGSPFSACITGNTHIPGSPFSARITGNTHIPFSACITGDDSMRMSHLKVALLLTSHWTLESWT